MRRDWTWLIVAIWCALAVLVSGTYALAHSYFDPWCCSGSDCAVIPDDRVELTSKGYRFTLRPGDHPMVTSPVEHTVPSTEARPSPDGTYAVCLYPDQTVVRCFYAPPPGV